MTKKYELSLNKKSDEKISVKIKSDESSFNSDVVDIVPLQKINLKQYYQMEMKKFI